MQKRTASFWGPGETGQTDGPGASPRCGPTMAAGPLAHLAPLGGAAGAFGPAQEPAAGDRVLPVGMQAGGVAEQSNGVSRPV